MERSVIIIVTKHMSYKVKILEKVTKRNDGRKDTKLDLIKRKPDFLKEIIKRITSKRLFLRQNK